MPMLSATTTTVTARSVRARQRLRPPPRRVGLVCTSPAVRSFVTTTTTRSRIRRNINHERDDDIEEEEESSWSRNADGSYSRNHPRQQLQSFQRLATSENSPSAEKLDIPRLAKASDSALQRNTDHDVSHVKESLLKARETRWSSILSSLSTSEPTTVPSVSSSQLQSSDKDYSVGSSKPDAGNDDAIKSEMRKHKTGARGPGLAKFKRMIRAMERDGGVQLSDPFVKPADPSSSSLSSPKRRAVSRPMVPRWCLQLDVDFDAAHGDSGIVLSEEEREIRASTVATIQLLRSNPKDESLSPERILSAIRSHRGLNPLRGVHPSLVWFLIVAMESHHAKLLRSLTIADWHNITRAAVLADAPSRPDLAPRTPPPPPELIAPSTAVRAQTILRLIKHNGINPTPLIFTALVKSHRSSKPHVAAIHAKALSNSPDETYFLTCAAMQLANRDTFDPRDLWRDLTTHLRPPSKDLLLAMLQVATSIPRPFNHIVEQAHNLLTTTTKFDAETYLALMHAHNSCGNFNATRRLWSSALTEELAGPEMHHHCCIAASCQGDHEAVRKIWRRHLQLDTTIQDMDHINPPLLDVIVPSLVVMRDGRSLAELPRNSIPVLRGLCELDMQAEALDSLSRIRSSRDAPRASLSHIAAMLSRAWDAPALRRFMFDEVVTVPRLRYHWTRYVDAGEKRVRTGRAGPLRVVYDGIIAGWTEADKRDAGQVGIADKVLAIETVAADAEREELRIVTGVLDELLKIKNDVN